MKIKHRSERMENFIEGAKEFLVMAAILAVMLAFTAILFASAP